MTATATYSPTGDAYVDGVLMGTKWGVTNLTFSFPTDPSFYGSPYGSGEPTNGFKAFTSIQQDAVRATLSLFASVAGVTFTEVTESAATHATLRYAESNSVSTAWGYYPSTADTGGDMWFNNSSHYYDSPARGNYAFLTIMHETGHALGLKHPQGSSGSFGAMPADKDSLEYTVMSYKSYLDGPMTGYTNGYGSYPTTLMMYDIAAVQAMYGANYATNAGDTVYRWSATTGEMSINGTGQGAPIANKIFMTVWDGGGHDTYDFSNYTIGLKVSLAPGGWTTTASTQLADLGSGHVATGNIANALLFGGSTASLIEDAVGGSGNDTILGNVADNRLTGNAGNDLLDGGFGLDTAIYAGVAADYQWVQNADGSWTVSALTATHADGVDTLRNIEQLQFSDGLVTIGTADRAPTFTSSAPSVSLSEWADLSADEVANTPHTAGGSLTYSDMDASDVHTASFRPGGTGYLGTFNLDASHIDADDTIGWSFAVADNAIDYLAAGQTVTQRYEVIIDDGHGGTAMQTVTITLVGTADGSTTTVKPGGGKGGKKGGGSDAAFDPDQHGQGNGHAVKLAMIDDQIPAAIQDISGIDHGQSSLASVLGHLEIGPAGSHLQTPVALLHHLDLLA